MSSNSLHRTSSLRIFLVLLAVGLAACKDKDAPTHQDQGDEDVDGDGDGHGDGSGDVTPLDECPSGTYGADCTGVCACIEGQACVEGRTGDGSCIARLHDALTYSDAPFGFSELAVENNLMVGVGVVTADELGRLFTIADGHITASSLKGNVRRLATAPLAVEVDDDALWRVDLADMASTRLSGNERVTAAWLSPDETKVLYTAVMPGSDTLDLLLTDRDSGPGGSLTHGALSGDIVTETSDRYGKFIVRPHATSDGSRIVFVVQNDDSSWDLYSVDVSGTGLIKLNGDGSVGSQNENSFAFLVAPGTSRVIYVADDDTAGVPELYAVDADGANKVKLSGALTGSGYVNTGYRNFTADVSPDGARVVFLANSDGTGGLELFSVPVAGGARQLLSGTESVLEDFWPLFTPDNDTVLYVSDRLRAVPTAGGTSLPLSGVGEITANYERGVVITADGLSVLYTAYEEPSENEELFVARLDGSDKRKLNAPFTNDGGLYSGGVGIPAFYLTTSGHVVYRASEDGEADYALFVVDLDGSNLRKMTPPLTHDLYLTTTYFTESNGKLFFAADPTVWTREELYSFDLASGELVNVSQSLPRIVTEDVVSRSLIRDSGSLLAATTSYSFSVYEKDLIIMDLAAHTSCHLNLPITATSRVLPIVEPTAVDLGSVYLMYSDGDGFRLYRAASNCEVSTITDPPLTNIGIGSVKVSADRQKMYFVEAQSPGKNELFVMDTNGNGRIRLSGDMVAGGSLGNNSTGSFAITADSSRVIYVADQDVDNVFELYAVDPNGDDRVKLNPAITTGSVFNNSQCFGFPFTPDSQRTVFAAKTTSSGPMELYSVKLDGTELHKLHPTMTGPGLSNTWCGAIQVTPDGTHVVYNAAQDGTMQSVYAATLDGSSNVKIGGQLYPGEYLREGQITPDSQYYVYQAYEPPDYVTRLIATRIDGGGSVLIGESPYDTASLALLPSGARLVYVLWHEDGGVLRARNADGTGAVDLADLPPGTRISSRADEPFVVTSDGHVVFVTEKAEADGNWSSAVMMVSHDGGAPSTIVPAAKARIIERIALAPDAATLLVVGDLGRPGVTEVFAYPL